MGVVLHFVSHLSCHHMARIMRDERKRLGLDRHDLHVLRYRGVMELEWTGCGEDEIAAYPGHVSGDMIRKHARIARQRMQATRAAEKRR